MNIALNLRALSIRVQRVGNATVLFKIQAIKNFLKHTSEKNLL